MDTDILYSQLKEAYSEANLNKLALELISLYKNEQYSILQKIADIISRWQDIEITEEGKGFNRFMLLYHPDRGDFFRKQIDEFYLNGKHDELVEFAHILKIQNIEELCATLTGYEDIDYSPVYAWDVNLVNGFSVNDEAPNAEYESMNDRSSGNSKNSEGFDFYDALKIRMYGHTEIEIPSYYLEDIDEIEMSQSNINDLSGIENCVHAISFDLSGNKIDDIYPLVGMFQIEDLNLSDNQITNIDALSSLPNLKSLNISYNLITDISPLFELENLVFVDISGNDISELQIQELEMIGIEILNSQF